jgi:sporulation protein YlmC with PRC-barrel domain
MTLNMFLGLLGIIITIIVGVMGIIYTYRIRNIPKITFLGQEFFSLFNSIIKNMDGINITFENIQIGPSLLMLKASFINNGTVDIDSSMVHEPLKIKLPENCKWKRIKITKTSQNVNVNLKMSDIVIEFNWDLLKKNEYFSFDALIEIIASPKESTEINYEYINKISDKIIISHRITNLEKINEESFYSIMRSKRLKKQIFPFITFIFLGLILLALTFIVPGQNLFSTHYIVKDLKNNDMEIKLTYLNNDNILIKSIDGKYKEVLTVDEFVKKHNIPLKIINKTKATYIFIIIASFSVLIGILGLVNYLFVKRKENYIKMLLDIK